MQKSDSNPMPSFEEADRGQMQGLITSAYGHMVHTGYLFLRLVGAPADAAAWLRGLLAAGHVMTSRTWRPDRNLPKTKPDYAVNVAFTHAGLKAWRVDGQTLKSFSPAFMEGPANSERAASLGDSGAERPDLWEFGGKEENAVHLVVVVHATTADERARVISILKSDLKMDGRDALQPVAGDQLGAHMIYSDPVRGSRVVKEHFGFNDGISQPELRGLKKDSGNRSAAGQNTCAAGEFVLGYPDEYGFYPPTPLTHRSRDRGGMLPESPYRAEHPEYVDFGYNGTYLVYRKMTQDVASFWGYLKEQCRQLFGKEDPQTVLWLAAKMVGRWPNGVPLVEAPDLVDMTRYCGHLNHFMFAESDPDGSACPFGSHVRRVNPRDQLKPGTPRQSLQMTRRHRLIRRGSTFGEPLFDLSILDNPQDVRALEKLLRLEDDGRERGLHFFCVNASIRRQFEFVQQSWSVSRTFNGLRDDPDPVVGDAGSRVCDLEDGFEIPGNPQSLRLKSLHRFTRTRASAYFFLPGLDTLRYLSTLNAG